MVNPIWKDYLVDLGALASIQYRITNTATGQVIYTGKAYRQPGQRKNLVKINSICADHMAAEFPSTEHQAYTQGGIVEFKVEAYSGTSWAVVDTIQFTNNWCYDSKHNPATMGIAYPIKNIVDERQVLLWSAYNATEATLVVTYRNGVMDIETIPLNSISTQADFTEGTLEVDGEVTLENSVTAGTLAIHMDEYPGADSININGCKYQVVPGCAKYALYYLNAFGGWDFLLIEGNTTETDNVTRHSRNAEYNNSSIQNRGKHNYANEITKAYSMVTGWVDDQHSQRMHNLFNSTNVFMCDISTGDFVPVVLTGTSCEYKTYKSNGNKLVNYTLEIEVAHNMVRR